MSKEQDRNISMIAMQIIMDAGDAREHVTKAIAAMEEFSFDIAEACLTDAQEKIKQAHEKQTEVIQDEVRGATCPFSILFSHAQDTLMTISSELNLTKRMLRVFRSMDARLQGLEKGKS